MISILALLAIAFLIGPRTFQAVLFYCLGHLQAFSIPLKLTSTLVWILLVYLPNLACYFIREGLLRVGVLGYNVDDHHIVPSRRGYPEFDSDLSSGL